jgi:hypothetical protein
MSFRASIIGGIYLFAAALPAAAHHTANNIDFENTVELSGKVVEFQWTNPYTALLLEVTNGNGEAQEWLLDLSSPGALTRRGWDATTLRPGDEINVTAYPLLDGSAGGRAVSVVLPDGTVTEQ